MRIRSRMHPESRAPMKFTPRSSLLVVLGGISVAGLIAAVVRWLVPAQARRPARLPAAPAVAVALPASFARQSVPADTASALVVPAAVAAPTEERAEGTAIPVVGNRHTLVFHALDSQVLPVEENREYFTSEAEALAAGYHRSKHDRDRERPTQ